MALGLTAALQGNLREMIERDRAGLDRAITQGVGEGTRSLQLRVRGEINARFKGSAFTRSGSRRVANAVRMRLYDDGPLKATGLVYSRFGKGSRADFTDYLAPFVFGATIKPLNSKWLYISLEKGQKARRSVRQSPAFRKNLAFVNIGGGRALLVRRTRTRSTPIALLLRRVTIRPRLDFKSIIADEDRRLGGRILEAFTRG